MFKVGKKYFTDMFIVLQDLQRDLILELNWQFNYKIDCNWNINSLQDITHNKTYLCISLPSTITKPILQTAGAFYLQPRSISIIIVQAPINLEPQCICEFSTSNDLPLGLIPLAVNHKINHKYPKLLNTYILNT